MTYRHIAVSFDPEARAAIIALNRPEVRNALNRALMEETYAAVQAALADDRVRSVILTGNGPAFAAGADMEELLRRDAFTENGLLPSVRRQLSHLLETMPKPSIAALNGHAMGGGLELALACTIRIAVPHARLALSEINLGIMPGNGGTQRLVRLAGLGVALEMALTGEPVPAAEALQKGFVNRVVPPEELLPAALAYARTFAAKPALALAAIKETMLLAVDVPLAAGLAYEAKWFGILCSGPDKQEGVRAFLEKRAPRFGETGAAEGGRPA